MLVARIEAELPLIMAMDILCRSQAVSRLSPVTSVMRRPSSAINFLEESPVTPLVSTESGSKRYRCRRLEYTSRFLASALLAAVAGVWALSKRADLQNVSLHVESQQRLIPFVKGVTVSPSGQRPSPRSRPIGSSQDCIPADSNERRTISLRLLCLGRRPALYLQDRP